MTSSLLGDSTYGTLRTNPFRLAVLPWGATEAHNYHLPYGTDNIETQWIAAEAATVANARGAGALVLPIVPFGVNTGQLSIPWTINMNPSTQMALLKDVLVSLERQGIGRLVVLNGHGGNDFRQMIRELQMRTPLFLCTTNWWTVPGLTGDFVDPGDHAGELETSVMMHLHPDLVLPLDEAGPGRARDWKVKAFRERWAWAPRQWTRVTDDTGVGDPAPATRAKGAAYFDALTTKLADFLVELNAMDPTDLYERGI